MFDFPKIEEKILKFWQGASIFKKTLDKDSPKGYFVFYEGPPTANGKPGIHHVLARAFKDLIPRFKTMQGYKVDRKAGWDTHGLPVELEVEKKLGLSNKKDVEEYGMEEFNKKCKESVWQYKEDWEKLTERIGFWVDMNSPYITYNNDYIESLWWVVKQAHERGLLYKGHKVIPQCPRCGTALSSHEVAQGYKNVEEDSVYIKFRIKNQESRIKNQEIDDNTYILAWTTTPWTLPGNIALAVGEEVEYSLVKQNGEYLIIAKNLLNKLEGEYELVREIKGKDLVSLEYEPLFPGVIKETDENYQNAFKVYLADFVSTEDGTGVVHTAVMYGIEDYELGEQVGLPKVHSVNLDGTFNELVPKWQGRFVKDVEKEIIDDLKARDILYKKESYKHDYPFCWRCDTPLIYYAKDSWFFKMSDLRDELIKNNQQINWAPEHIKEGRFGEWLKDVKDWAISRERYWGTPLPIWKCSKCDDIKVIGSYEDLGIFTKLKNTYYLVRHGEAESNIEDILNSDLNNDHYHLTDRGRKQVEEMSVGLKGAGINKIVHSPFIRTRETAEIIGRVVGIQTEENQLLKEYGAGQAEGKSSKELLKLVGSAQNEIEEGVPGGEKPQELASRTKQFVEQMESKYNNQQIVVVSHGDPLTKMISFFTGRTVSDIWHNNYPQTGQCYKHERIFSGGDKEFDPHRPFIDEIKLKCDKCGGEMTRVPEVMDCWFDSGSMPFAQWHYPFENKEKIDNAEAFPADYISEAIDQTRGWFYTLLAVATILGKEAPYKNVICLGHILDKEGLKMSKSRGNVVNPWEMIDKYGADALRWHLYTMSQAGEPKRFDEKNLKESSRIFVTLLNVVSFYKMFADEKLEIRNLEIEDLDNILDKWINTKLRILIKEVTNRLEGYDITTAGRRIEDFINDLSTWYVRRSRDRFKGENEDEKIKALKTLRCVIFNLNRLMSPFVPFITEHIYQEMGGIKESVHLESWPASQDREIDQIDQKVLDYMEMVRKIVELGLAKRSEVGIKVRQPLKKLKIKNKKLKIEEEYIDLIKDEVNVKAVEMTDGDGDMEVELDMEMDEELKKEGVLRDMVRAINGMRKKMGLTIDDKINLFYNSQDELIDQVVREFSDELKKSVIAEKVEKSDAGLEEVKVGDVEVGIRLEIINN